MRDLNAYAKDCMGMLDSIGIQYGNVIGWSVNTRAKSRWGQTKVVPGGYTININADLLDERNSERGLKNTIIHELLHTCKGCMNHGPEWQRLAGIVKDCYCIDIKRCSTSEEKGVTYHREARPTREYIVECPCCGTQWVRHRMCDLIQFPGFYSCGKCHQPLKRIK